MTRIGVRGIPENQQFDAIDDFEIDAIDPEFDSAADRRRILRRLLPHQSLVLSFGHFFLRGEDSVDQRERARSAVERIELFEARSSSILVPASFATKASLSESLHCIDEEFTRSGLRPPRIDAPFEIETSLERIGDPLWRNSKTEYLTKEWRIHGYHPARWVRMYSEEALKELALKTVRYKPERILFAHSQRRIQACAFIDVLEKLHSN